MRLLILAAAFALCLPAATHYVTVAGLGGEPDYEQRFAGWAQTIDQVLRESRTEAKIETFSGADATRERLRSSLEQAAQDYAEAGRWLPDKPATRLAYYTTYGWLLLFDLHRDAEGCELFGKAAQFVPWPMNRPPWASHS